MKTSYLVSGMHCEGCTKIVTERLQMVSGMKNVIVNLEKGTADLETETPIELETLQAALNDTIYEIVLPAVKSNKNTFSEKVREENIKKLVSAYVAAIAQGDYAKLLEYLQPDFEFDGMIQLHSSTSFIEMLKKHTNAKITKNEVKAIFVDGDEVCVIYDTFIDKPAPPISILEWLIIKDDKISSTKLKFNRLSMLGVMEVMKNGK